VKLRRYDSQLTAPLLKNLFWRFIRTGLLYQIIQQITYDKQNQNLNLYFQENNTKTYGEIRVKHKPIGDSFMKFACFIMSLGLLASCCNDCDRSGVCVGQAQNNQHSDWQITSKVKTSIVSDGSLSASSRLVSVTTNNGVVTISGTVASKDDMNRIVQLAKDVDGVKKVDNQMTVSGP